MDNSGYSAGVGVTSRSGGVSKATSGAEYWTLDECKRSYRDYLGNKRAEIEEQKIARRYYHCDQWTEKEIKELNKRKQPIVTFNRIGRKIDGVVGLIERLRQEPKAYPRTPKHEEGAELATAVIRYLLDEQEWKAKSPECARDGAVDGIGGIEIEITQGDHGDAEVSFEVVEPDSFFYDPRSFRNDFSDAKYMGLGKWLDIDTAKEMFPDKADAIETSSDSEFSTSPDRETKWSSTEGTQRFVRVVDIWYKHHGEWCWTIFTGGMILQEGTSYLLDEKKKTICKYVMFSCNIDQDGDRYGFPRNMLSAQDEINHRRSKSLHMLNSKRLIMSQGAVTDVEKARKEWARSDGVVLVQTSNVNEGVKVDDQTVDFAGQLKMMENAIAELENYGPNQALIGDAPNQSGRAISLLQQAGMAELGPYIMGYRGWKIRVYRTLFSAAQQHWQAERWVRVTDDDGLAQFLQVNGVGIDPQTGQPTTVNALGSLDVDIILDEGPDQINMMADAYDTLTVLASKGAQVPPDLLIELSPIQSSVKKKYLDRMKQAEGQPNPEVQAAQAKMQMEGQNAQMKLELEREKAMAEAGRKRDETTASLELERERQAQELMLARERAAQEMALEREKALLQIQLKAEISSYEMEVANAAQSEQNGRETADKQQASDGMAQVIGRLGELIAASQQATEAAIRAPKHVSIQRSNGLIDGADIRVGAE